MTFYWWSHWFWITLLSLVVFHPACVHTYPSQEAEGPRPGDDNPQMSITKLYQATTTIFARPTERTHHHQHDKNDEQTAEAAEDDTEYPLVDANGEAEAGVVEMERPIEDNAEEDEESGELRDFEFKRSAETLNATEPKAEVATGEKRGEKPTGEQQLPVQPTEISNYTNFSRSTGSTNASQVAAETLKTPPANGTLADTGPLTGRENGSTTLAWLNAVATVTVNEDKDEEERDKDSTGPHKAPFTLENVNKEEELRRAENEHRTRKSKGLSAEYKHANRFGDSKNLLTRSAATATATSPNEYDNDGGNISSEALAIQRTYFLDAGAISAICFTVFGFCCTVGTIGIVLYRRRFLNKPQALSEPDSSVYIDDSTMRVSDNSDEMYSLDNDSFLNSLEAMTIQNYWTDTVKHTKL